jgi:hypothetical protein
MLAAAGTVALSSRPDTALVVVIVCVIGAVSTVAAGCWQAAKVIAIGESADWASSTAADGCGGACATCTLSCS